MGSSKVKNPGGRPPKFDSPEGLAKQVLAYIDNCTENRTMPNKAGLCIWLNIHKDTYCEYKKKPGFSDSLKRAEMWIENAWVNRLSTNAPTGAIFYLKNAFKEDYRDRNETDLTTGGKELQPILVKFIDGKQGN